jgi:hypothetical protein
MERLKALLRGSAHSDEAKRIWRDHDRLTAQMVAYETAKLEDWCAAIGDVSEQTLKQPLLRCAAKPLRRPIDTISARKRRAQGEAAAVAAQAPPNYS